MKKITLLTSLLFLAATVTTPQDNGAPTSAEAEQLREEIQTIEKLLPQLSDRGPALFQLAHDYASLGDLSKGLSLLKECIALREGFDPENDSAFDRLRGDAEFKSLVGRVQREFPPVRRARLAFTVPESDLIPEGLAVDLKRRVFYMGNINRGKIVRINSHGEASDPFLPSQYGVQSICGIKVDPTNGDVWANGCSDGGKGAELLHFDAQGKLLERFGAETPGPHLFNDLVLRNSDEIYLTDSLAHVALRFHRKTHAFAVLRLSRSMYYPNGIALSGDGNVLYVADAFGVLQYELKSQKAREVHAGRFNTISGMDGMYWYRGALIGIQNSLGSPRVARFQLSADGSRVTSRRVLEYRSEFVELPTTGAIEGTNFYFMANTHIDNWKNGTVVDPKKLGPVRIAVVSLR